jgi:hypothetical protein
MNTLLLEIGHLLFGFIDLLLVESRPIRSSQIFPFTSFLAALDSMLKRFTETLLTHEEERFQCALTKLNLELFL